MNDSGTMKYSISLSIEEVRLPPFEDILIVGRKSPHGKMGIAKSFHYLVPNEFEMCEIEDEIVEVVFINKRLLKKIDKERVISLLKKRVFPYVSPLEILKVECKLKLFYESIEGEL